MSALLPTLIGVPTSTASDYGMLLRHGTAGEISNALICGWNDACLNIDHMETWTSAVRGSTLTNELTISNTMMSCADPYEEDAADPVTLNAFFETMNMGNRLLDPQLRAPYDIASPDFRPATGSPALTGADVPMDAFFEQVDYLGAMGTDNWTAGWTTNVPN